MSYSQEGLELQGRFETEWAERTLVAYPGFIFDPPSPPVEWCRFGIINSEGQQVDFGANLKNHRYPGLIFVQVFIPMDEGDALALQRADEVASIFHRWRGTNITCKTASVRRIGSTGDGYYQVNVFIPFVRDELN